MPILSNASWGVKAGTKYTATDPFGGNDLLQGKQGDDTIDGGDGNDIVVGGRGSDTLYGGEGNDSLFGDLGPSQPYIVDIVSDSLFGGAGDDYLDGGWGDDYMAGGSGNDVYIVNSPQDIVSEETRVMGDIVVDAGGIDEVRANTYQFTLGANVENLTFTTAFTFAVNTGNGNELDNVLTGAFRTDELYGHDGNDTLFGNGGDDLLDGGAGQDAMIGGTGNDTYFVDDAGDQVIEMMGQGIDKIITTLTAFNLGDNIENLSASSTQAFHGVGNDLDNIIVGNLGDDILEGRNGDDTLTGGEGADTFVYTDADLGHDMITDFNEAEGDRLDFSGMTGVHSYADLLITTDDQGNTVISYGETSVTLNGISADSLDGSEFDYAPDDSDGELADAGYDMADDAQPTPADEALPADAPLEALDMTVEAPDAAAFF